MKKIAFLPLLLLAACTTPLPSVPESSFDRLDLASVVKLNADTVFVRIQDYFPALMQIDSVVSDDLLVLPIGNYDEVALIPYANTPWISTMEVWSEGVQATLVMQKEELPSLKGADRTKAPLLLTNKASKEAFEVKVDNTPADYVALWQNTRLPEEYLRLKDDKLTVYIPENAAGMERSFIRLFASNDNGIANDVLVPLAHGKVMTSAAEVQRNDKHGMVMYSLMIDRFNNGNPDNDIKLNSPYVLPKVDYFGGDLSGIIQKIKDGFFADLGINTIWISPITQNPFDAWGFINDPKTKFSGYHGYWPLYATKVDIRFGTEDELRKLLDEAHKRQINVILDYVAHHMHINSPTLKANPDWTTPMYTPDGRLNFELWDEFRLTTWFDRHIPTFDLSKPEAYDPLTDSALYWIANFDFDGFRHDATKHVPEVFWRTLTQKAKLRFPNRNIYQIGETYGSPALIGSYVKSGMLDAQFDFNVYDAAIAVLIDAQNTSFEQLSAALQASLDNYGYHNLMGYISGNHDRPRFISLAGGAIQPDEDTKAIGWKRDIGVGDEVGYARLALLQAFIMTIPGVPCIYQGDEFGQPGANDPDNRRMMQFSDYNQQEQDLLDKVKHLTHLRRSSMSLMYGSYVPLSVTKDVLVYARVYMGQEVVVALNKSDRPQTITVNTPLANKPLTMDIAANDYSLKL
ncbi:MAG: alpha-amylase family glycosyl hydrolase [Bacteroidales bacterium]|nr:alpha-amylase family glycosyl hydrolase [Bacteroidales bacterium]MCL2133120.1 alpha-amylase family glycosyl hydrolase [Bacteroidales bacterium]